MTALPVAATPAYPEVIPLRNDFGPEGITMGRGEATVETGLDAISYIQCGLIRSINRNRLVHHLGAVGPDISNQVATIIRTLLNY